MTLRTAYLIALVVFLLTLPVTANLDTIVFLARGYGRDVVSMRDAPNKSEDLRERISAAFDKEGPTIALWTRVILASWVAMLGFSIVVIRMGVPVPFKLHYVGTALSGLLTLVVVVPLLLFGKELPPRPF